MTKQDRLILINQYEILSSLRPDESDRYKELVEILTSGYKIFYDQMDEWLSDEMADEESVFVLDILQLYRAIEDFKSRNGDVDLSLDHLSYFRGFDGNNEGSYLSFARFLIEVQSKYTEQTQYFEKNDHLNSHMPMVKTYTRMLRTWKSLGGSYQLSKEQVLNILQSED